MATRTYIATCLLAAWGCWAAAASGQAAAPGGGAGEIPAVVPDPGGDDLNSVLEMTEAEKAEQLKRKADLMFSAERMAAGVEIKGDLLYLKKDIDAALAGMTDNPANTQKDNLERICRAMAKVDARFAKCYGLFVQGKGKEAAEAAKKFLDPQRATYLTAATYYVYAESLAASGDAEGAVDAYKELLAALPYHMSFAATASVRTAQLYEGMHRFYYAMHMYNNARNDYAVFIPPAQQAEYARKVEEFAKIYEDPMRSVVDRMADARKRLDAVDSGADTQKKEQEVIAILDDLIKTMDDASRKPSPKPGEGAKGEKKPGEDQGGQPKPAGGAPSVVNAQPTSPATTSQLPGGKAAPAPAMEKVFSKTEQGDWSNLPPVRREEIRRAMEKVISERNRDAIRDFHDRMAKHGQ